MEKLLHQEYCFHKLLKTLTKFYYHLYLGNVLINTFLYAEILSTKVFPFHVSMATLLANLKIPNFTI